MKRAFFAFVASFVVAGALAESPEPIGLRITTWNLEWFPNGSAQVFASFFSLGDLERLKEPWPEGDKLRVVANAIDSGQIDNTDDDIRFYGTMWERLERLGQLIGLIDKKI